MDLAMQSWETELERMEQQVTGEVEVPAQPDRTLEGRIFAV
jgi:hypothetical protein